MRLIDANKLFEEVGKIKSKNYQQYEDIGMFMNMITNSKEYIGEWILDDSDNSVSCSDCKCTLYLNDIIDGEGYYCPNCGRKMY